MKRYIIVGAVCLLVGFLLNILLFLTVGGMRYSAAHALAGREEAPAPAAEALAFGADKSAATLESLADEGGVVGGVVGGTMGGAAGGMLGGMAGIAGKKQVRMSTTLPAPKGGESGESPATPGRAWFPETFLFEPLVVTDASGMASVPVRVPDRLTSWRVLALAHSRSGAQAGAVSTFTGSLPTYVDPVLPAFLRTGDVARVPVQVVNTTDAPVTRALTVRVQGAQVEGGSRTVTVPAAGSVVEYITLRAAQPGPVTFQASLGGTDSVERGFTVWPSGRPVEETRGGTLAAPRSLELEGPAHALEGSERVRLLVFPGALGVLRAELAAAPEREGVADAAYALLLAGRAPKLLTSLGSPGDAKMLERMAALATQQVLRAGRAPAVTTAAMLVEAALAHPDNPVLVRLSERLSAQVVRAQRPDGTCQGADGWTLQRLMVATADCVRAVRAGMGTEEGRRRAMAFNARAAGAFERYLPRVLDGYTAAAILASGGVSDTVGETLRKRVRDDLQTRPDGSAFLPVDRGIVRADGQVPSQAEANALAVLALVEQKTAELANLGTSLLADYRPGLGWGDGRANLAGLQAALALFQDPMPSQVRVVLERDGQGVAEGVLDTKASQGVLALEAGAAGSEGKHIWSVRAEPVVPGLGFSLTLASYVPWVASVPGNGLELAVKDPQELKAGLSAEVAVQAAAPAGMELVLRHELPAGVQVDRPSLDALVRARKVSSYEVEDGAVSLTLPPRKAAEPFVASFKVIPTLAGTLQAGASSLMPVGHKDQRFYVAPVTWAVR